MLLFFDYFDKSLIVLSVGTSSISIALFTIVIGATVGIEGVNCGLAFLISPGFKKKLLKKKKERKKKHNKIVMLARSKLNSTESITMMNSQRGEAEKNWSDWRRWKNRHWWNY